MSQKNLEKVPRGFAEYNRGDIEEALKEWAPDAVWDWSNGHGFDAGVYRGRDEIRAFWRQRTAAWEENRLEIVDLLEVNNDRVIVENVAYSRGRDGIEVEARSAWLVTFQDGAQTRSRSTRRSRMRLKPSDWGVGNTAASDEERSFQPPGPNGKVWGDPL